MRTDFKRARGMGQSYARRSRKRGLTLRFEAAGYRPNPKTEKEINSKRN
jgi:hypothetical protein